MAQWRRCLRRWMPALIACALACASSAGAGAPETPPRGVSRLAEMSLEELADLEISSVSKRAEPRTGAAAAIFVITQEDIRRSTAVTLPDLLRSVPGLHVASLDANKRSVSARGFSGRYANALLVLIDGRSIYNPLFSGTEWESYDLMLENIDRIEVIRGPGSALWGANAVNGVINIVTKPASDTQGGLLSLGAGTEYRGFGAFRYGAAAGEHGHYRLYLRLLDRDDAVFERGDRAADDALNARGGGRWDWAWDDDRFTLIANLNRSITGQTFEVTSRRVPLPQFRDDDTRVTGADVLGRWTRAYSGGAELRVQAYYDHWHSTGFELDETRDTLDLEIQYRMAALGRHEFMFGGGFRYYDDRTGGSLTTSFSPADQRKRLFSAFIQDRIALAGDALTLTLGAKFEHNDFTGLEIQPSARLAWTPNDRHTLWAAVSRAVRTPSLAEEAARVQALEFPGVTAALYGNRDYDSENLLAFEAGYRVRPAEKLQLDLAVFYNRYENLRSLELGLPFVEVYPLPIHIAIPFHARNNHDAETYGVELAADWRPAGWWRLRAHYSLLRISHDLNARTLDPVSGSVSGSYPRHQAYLASYMNLGHNVDLDAALRYASGLPALAVEEYITLDIRLAWRPHQDFELAIVGHDLLDARHTEFDATFINTVPTQVQRGVYGKLTWRF
ncbi:MAG: TonB-dependent receptor [Candidatus Hydrogenedentes bacterium]|nr:TonB-dependent receptor [Candidatus Hydrogenedentota bacterium]